jgi:hypothetical protein
MPDVVYKCGGRVRYNGFLYEVRKGETLREAMLHIHTKRKATKLSKSTGIQYDDALRLQCTILSSDKDQNSKAKKVAPQIGTTQSGKAAEPKKPVPTGKDSKDTTKKKWPKKPKPKPKLQEPKDDKADHASARGLGV